MPITNYKIIKFKYKSNLNLNKKLLTILIFKRKEIYNIRNIIIIIIIINKKYTQKFIILNIIAIKKYEIKVINYF